MQSGDPLVAEELRAALPHPGGRWRHLEVIAETGSTNADLAEGFRAGRIRGGAVLVADHQSAGRGRQGRTWTAPPGTSIAMSVLIEPAEVPDARWSWLPLLTGLAVAEALHRAFGVPTALKWPNDVLVGEAKICGVLAERLVGPTVVLGMGVNVDLPAEQLPVPTATSLAVLEPGVVHSRRDLILAVLTLLELWLGRWESEAEATGLASAYRERCATLGRLVEVHLAGDRVITGRAVDVDGDGRLVVATEEGQQVFAAGDVVHVR